MNSTDTYQGVTYIIPCSGTKAGHTAPARDLYTGQMFRHTLTAALAAAAWDEQARILILSAKHGLVELDEVLDPYEQKMGQHGSVTPGQIAAQARELGIDWGAGVYTLLPRAYYRPLDEALKTLDVYAQDIYEAATAGIGEQRGVNRCVTQN